MTDHNPDKRFGAGAEGDEDLALEDVQSDAHDDRPAAGTAAGGAGDTTEAETLEAGAADIAAPDPRPQPHKLSKKEVLARLLEKNEILLKLNKDNLQKDAQLRELNDRFRRSMAEFENYRKRTRKEWELLKQQTKAEIIAEFLSVLDDFERAFSVVESEGSDFVQGIRLIYNNLIQSLDRLGVSEIVSGDAPFDPRVHMAVGQVESETVASGHVAEVIQKGYRMDETVIRPARVIVAK